MKVKFFLSVISILFLAGCLKIIIIQSDEYICTRPVRVHLACVTDAEYVSFWEHVSMTEYWQTEPPHDIRDRWEKLKGRNLAMEDRFGPTAKSCQIRLDKNHPIFACLQGRNINYLLVLVDMPDRPPYDRPGSADTRRKAFDLRKWKGAKRITINIENNNIYPAVE